MVGYDFQFRHQFRAAGVGLECPCSRGQIVMPIHHETAFASNADMNAFAEGVNEILQRKNVNARMLNPQRMKWYKIQVGMDME